NKRRAGIVAFLCRARGDLKAARAAAERSGDALLAEALALEAGDWKALAAQADSEMPTPLEKLAYRAAYLRLAGKARELDEARAALKKLGEAGEGPGQTPFLAAAALFLNDGPDDALPLLDRAGRHVMELEILLARSRFQEALKITERERSKEWPDQEQLDVR